MQKLPKIIQYIIQFVGVVFAAGIVYMFWTFAHFGPGNADYTYKIANTCTLNRTSAHQITVGCENIKGGVSPKVVSVGWNEKFLVAKSHPLHQTDSNSTYEIPDESVTYWWIIDLKNEKKYGPLKTEEEFNKKKVELGITGIELLSVEEAKIKGTWVNGDFKN